MLIGGIVIGVAAVIGIIAGVVVSQLNKNKNSGNSSLNSTSSSSGGNATLSNPGDPSQFTKDARLKQSFWGFAYTPNVGF